MGQAERVAPPSALERTLAGAPAPALLSMEGQQLWTSGVPMPEAGASDLSEQRDICAEIQAALGARQMVRYGVAVEEAEIGGVPVRIFRPAAASPGLGEDVLINCHGGGFTKDSGSLTENVPIAGLAGRTVVAVLYRLAPEHPFPAAVEDVEAVYRALLAQLAPQRIGLYGTSAGAILCAQALVRFAAGGLPMPARLGFFSGASDFSNVGDSEWFFPLLDDPRPLREILEPYLQDAPRTDPAVSPGRADLSRFPPTLCITSTRDLMLSQTASFHRTLVRQGVDARLLVFEALPHAHWSYLELPESDEAFGHIARFLAPSEQTAG